MKSTPGAAGNDGGFGEHGLMMEVAICHGWMSWDQSFYSCKRKEKIIRLCGEFVLAGKLIELSAESHGDGRRDKGCCMIFDYGDCRELLVVIEIG